MDKKEGNKKEENVSKNADEIIAALNVYVTDMKQRRTMAAADYSLGYQNFPAYAHNTGNYLILMDIEALLKGEKIKTTEELTKEQEEAREALLAKVKAEKEHSGNYIH